MNRAQVWGLGTSGYAAAKLLKKNGWEVIVNDRQNTSVLMERCQKLTEAGVNVVLGSDLSEELIISGNIQLLIISPGISWQHPFLAMAQQEGIATWGEVELAWRYSPEVPWVGITGTNGKSTTTALISRIFTAAGYYAPACGNIGLPISEIALQPDRPHWLIAELSSYQIESSPSVCPQIGIWTTFTPDHLSRHGTIENYANIKASLLDRSQQQILNGDDKYLVSLAGRFPEAVWTSTTHQNADAYIAHRWLYFRQEPIVSLDRWQLLGQHNIQNLLMAVAAARLAGIDGATIGDSVAGFQGMPHRLECLGRLDHAMWINDSKATNYDAAAIGLQAVTAPIILIAGGLAKQGDPQAWLAQITTKAAFVLLIGAAAPLFASFLEKVHFTNYAIAETLEVACDQAVRLARDLGCSAVLFSPACASFDQYTNFEQRGDHFRYLYQALKS